MKNEAYLLVSVVSLVLAVLIGIPAVGITWYFVVMALWVPVSLIFGQPINGLIWFLLSLLLTCAVPHFLFRMYLKRRMVVR